MASVTVKLSLSAIAHTESRINRGIAYDCEHYDLDFKLAKKYHARANEFQAWHSFMLALGE